MVGLASNGGEPMREPNVEPFYSPGTGERPIGGRGVVIDVTR